MQKLATQDADIAYSVTGNGPPLLLIAGFASDSASWLPILPALESQHTVIRFDNRLCGQTLCTGSAEITVDRLVGDALAVLDHLSLNRVHVAGHSFGGYLALRLAETAPERLDRIAVMASTPTLTPFSLTILQSVAAMRRAGMADRDWLKALFLWLRHPDFFADSATVDTTLKLAAAYPHAQSLNAMTRQIDVISHAAPLNDLQTIVSPVLSLIADTDILLPPALAVPAFNAIPDVHHIKVQNAGHSIHWDAPDAVATALLDFFTAG